MKTRTTFLYGSLVLCQLLTVGVSPAFAADKGVLEEVRHLVAANFYDKAARARIAAPTSDGQPIDYDAEIARELASLNASHTGRYTPDTIDYYEILDVYSQTGIGDQVKKLFQPGGSVTYDGIRIAPRTIDAKTFVAYVYDGSTAAKAGILVGDELISVDGQPYSQIGSFKGKAGYEATLELRRHEGEAPITRRVMVETIQPGDAFMNGIKASARIIEKDGVKVGYVRVWAYTRDDVPVILRELLAQGTLSTADALVFDMRCRWGGAPLDAAELFLGGTPNISVAGPDGEATYANYRWRKPVVAIIDRGTRSGMEVMAYALRKGGVPMVGSNTAGAALAGRPFVLSDGSFLTIASMNVTVDGQSLEGRGVAPSIAIAASLPYAAGRDPQLERAVAEAVTLSRVKTPSRG